MKKGIYYLSLLFSSSLQAQIEVPFNMISLVEQTSYETSKDSILPSYQKEAFIYINQKTGQPAFNKEFKEAYPFYGKSALVYDSETKSYNAINRNGDFILERGKYKQMSNPVDCSIGSVKLFTAQEGNMTEINYELHTTEIVNECSQPYRPFCAYPVYFRVPFTKNEAGKYIANANCLEVDEVKALDRDYFMVLKEGKIGIVHKNGKILVPIEYEESTITFAENKSTYIGIVPLKKENIWYYFNNGGDLITENDNACHHFFNSSEIKLGVYKKGEKYSILYKDGSSSKDYDWISEQGYLARRKNDFYFIFEKKAIPYYVK
ncbi:hypothetical protein QWZ06_11460 [Chryseobacterium tructae]|uniref:WG repeat-containing protein n=1 Tax=Chryseobacterium tructae TaxID=1037380 RepID=A0ABV7XY75_9FLAO|nr:hypothetical protein [Chryseobacterium tructae]MDN3692851.1 hypothetical protein [Chryseobacterium tructae]